MFGHAFEKKATNHIMKETPETPLDALHASPQRSLAFHFVTAAKADSHNIANKRSTAIRAYGFANFRVRGNREVMVR